MESMLTFAINGRIHRGINVNFQAILCPRTSSIPIPGCALYTEQWILGSVNNFSFTAHLLFVQWDRLPEPQIINRWLSIRNSEMSYRKGWCELSKILCITKVNDKRGPGYIGGCGSWTFKDGTRGHRQRKNTKHGL